MLTSGDLDQVRTHLCSALRPHNIDLGRGRPTMNFIHNQASIGDLALNAMYYGTPIHVEAPETEDVYLFMLTLAGAAHAKQGSSTTEIGSGTVYVFNPTRKLDITLSRDNKQLVVRLPRANVERFLKNELSRSLADPLEFETRPISLGGEAPGLQTFIQSMCQDLDQPVSGYARQSVAGHVESMFLSLVLSALPHNYSDLYLGGGSGAAPYFVRRAEDFMRTNMDQPITVNDMAEAACTSVRSLQSGFRNFRDTTPTAYLRDMRLEKSRQELLKAAANKLTVTDVALACGFTHLSKFSLCYRNRFGESPSETLKRGG